MNNNDQKKSLNMGSELQKHGYKVDESITCTDALQFLDYLRKSQCSSVEGLNISGKIRGAITLEGEISGNGLTPYSLFRCTKVLDQMESVAADCLAGIRSK